MNALKALAATIALVTAGATPGFATAASGAHGGGFGRAGRPSAPAARPGVGNDDRSHFFGADRGGGAGPGDPWRHRPWGGRGRRGLGWGYGYGYLGGYPYDGFDAGDDGAAGPGPAYGPMPFGPGPFGGAFAEGYGPAARPMAPALAPMAYGPGAHDGAYAYGYNGYAQTPPLPQVGPAGYWLAGPGARGCGC